MHFFFVVCSSPPPVPTTLCQTLWREFPLDTLAYGSFASTEQDQRGFVGQADERHLCSSFVAYCSSKCSCVRSVWELFLGCVSHPDDCCFQARAYGPRAPHEAGKFGDSSSSGHLWESVNKSEISPNCLSAEALRLSDTSPSSWSQKVTTRHLRCPCGIVTVQGHLHRRFM